MDTPLHDEKLAMIEYLMESIEQHKQNASSYSGAAVGIRPDGDWTYLQVDQGGYAAIAPELQAQLDRIEKNLEGLIESLNKARALR